MWRKYQGHHAHCLVLTSCSLSGRGHRILQGGGNREGLLNHPLGHLRLLRTYHFLERNQNCVHELESFFSIQCLMVFPGRKKKVEKNRKNTPNVCSHSKGEKGPHCPASVYEMQRKVLITQAPGPFLI